MVAYSGTSVWYRQCDATANPLSKLASGQIHTAKSQRGKKTRGGTVTRLVGIHMKSTAAEHSHCVATCDSPWLTGVFMPIVRKGALEREAQRVLTRPVSISVSLLGPS